MPTIDALLGGAPSEEDKLRAMAETLRGQKRAADVFGMSTLKPVAGAAQTESQNILGAAKQGGELRQARELAEMKAKAATDVANINAGARRDVAGQSRQPRIPQAALKRLEEKGDTLRNLDSVIGNYKKDYSNPAFGMPGAGTISNAIAGNAPLFASKEMEERQAWWAQFKDAFENVTRHALYGGALTETEKNEWRKAIINPDMTDEQIKRILDQMNKVRSHEGQVAGRNAIMNNIPADIVENTIPNFGESTDTADSDERKQETQVINGVTYIKENGQWFEQ